MCLHSRINREANHVVEQIVSDGSDDVRRSDDVPLSADFFAVCEQGILLTVSYMISWENKEELLPLTDSRNCSPTQPSCLSQKTDS